MKKPGTRGGWPNILKIGINLAFLEEKNGCRVEWNGISSLYFKYYQHYMVYRCAKVSKLAKTRTIEVGGEKLFFMSCFDYLMTSQRLNECKIMKSTWNVANF